MWSKLLTAHYKIPLFFTILSLSFFFHKRKKMESLEKAMSDTEKLWEPWRFCRAVPSSLSSDYLEVAAGPLSQVVSEVSKNE